MSLQQVQAEFMASLQHAELPLPSGCDARFAQGLAVYRNNYQSVLLDAMRSTFERTCGWVGEDAFTAAATHQCVLHPPSGWTLDDVGRGFAETLAALFAQDPEVADLAALEWAMHRAFSAADAEALDMDGFRHATDGFCADDWAGMRLRLQPALHVVAVRTDCVGLWRALAGSERPADPPVLAQAHAAIVWREDWRPVCRLVAAQEAEALRALCAGRDYGGICAQLAETLGADAAAREAGRMLSRWLHDGLLCGVHGPAP